MSSISYLSISYSSIYIGVPWNHPLFHSGFTSLLQVKVTELRSNAKCTLGVIKSGRNSSEVAYNNKVVNIIIAQTTLTYRNYISPSNFAILITICNCSSLAYRYAN